MKKISFNFMFSVLILSASMIDALSSGSAWGKSSYQGTGWDLPSAPSSGASSDASVGVITENSPSKYIILADSQQFKPILDFHEIVAKNLPSDVGIIYVFNPEASFTGESDFLKKYKTDFGSGRFQLIEHALEGSWARDYMPELVRLPNGKIRAVTFNYFRSNDTEASKALIEKYGWEYNHVPIEIEGGNLVIDSFQKRIFLSESTLKRNPKLSKIEIEKMLKSALLEDSVYWLPELPNEQTGHADVFARLVTKDTFFVADSFKQDQKIALDKTAQILLNLGYKVVRITSALTDSQNNENSFYSYINSLIVNNTVFVPSYSLMPDDNGKLNMNMLVAVLDERAKKAYTALGLKVVQVPMFTMAGYGGTVHCLTKQVGIPLSN